MSVPSFEGNEWKYLKECLDSGWVSSASPWVDRFEREIARTVGAPHAVATVNGTTALHVALLLAGVEPGDEVLVPDMTFIAPVNAIRYCQAFPVLVDVDSRTWQIDPEKIERFLTQECRLKGGECFNQKTGRRVRAILPVHLLGLACDMDRILGLARRFGLKVVEDAAEGLGVHYAGRHIGTWGDVGVLSFNGNKIITSGGGGMILTQDPSLAQRARYLSTQARDDAAEYIHREVGYNYRLTGLQAALGLAQLERLEEFIARKRSIARAYEERLRAVEGITLMPSSPRTEATCWLYTILLPEETAVEERRSFIRALRRQGFEARGLWHPIHGLDPYRDCQAVEIEASDRLYRRAVSLPSSVSLGIEQVKRCAEAVAQAKELEPS